MGMDRRIGSKFLNAGIGYGGSCFPKDTKALNFQSDHAGVKLKTVKATIDVNREQRTRLIDKARRFFPNFRDVRVAIIGLTFKPGTDDMREAPALVLIEKLKQSGCNVRAYDPAAMDESRRRIGESVYYAHDMYDAALDADALILVTEWKEFRLPTWGVIKKAMKQPVVLDGRNIYDGDELQEMGFVYHCIGR